MPILRNWLKGFTPLEIRRQRRLTAARGNLSLTGFTLVEISIVVAILAVAGTAAVWIGMGHAFI